MQTQADHCPGYKIQCRASSQLVSFEPLSKINYKIYGIHGVEWSWSGNEVRNFELFRDYCKVIEAVNCLI